MNTREQWLYRAKDELLPIFAKEGYVFPEVKLSCGFASTGAKKHIGQCFPTSMSESFVNEIFISPVLADPIEVLDTLMHELVHAIDDCKNKHGANFKKIALAVGLQGKMRSASAGEKLKECLASVAENIGPYPHTKINFPIKVAKTTSRPKAVCEECGYEARVSKKWQHLGVPICPQHLTEMTVHGEWKYE